MENRKSVLLADASEEFRHLFAGALAEEDDIVLIGETGDGQEAVRLAREQQPDVMVMDLVLSRMDGLEVLQALAGQSPRPRVLVLSSFARGNMAELAASCGADYYMMKPCKLSTVIERIRQMAAGSFQGDGEGESARNGSREVSLESTVTAIIHEIGVPAHIKGYQYLREAILIAVADMEVINAVTKGGQALRHYGQPGRAGDPACHRSGLGPGRPGDAAKIFRLYRLKRKRKAHQFGIHRHDRRPPPASAKGEMKRAEPLRRRRIGGGRRGRKTLQKRE